MNSQSKDRIKINKAAMLTTTESIANQLSSHRTLTIKHQHHHRQRINHNSFFLFVTRSFVSLKMLFSSFSVQIAMILCLIMCSYDHRLRTSF